MGHLQVASAVSLYFAYVHQAQASYNNHIGVPLTALSMPQESNAAVFEFGTSGKGEIEVLSKLINPHIRVITDIQPAHLEGLQGVDGVAQEKIQLFLTAREHDCLVFNAANSDVWQTLLDAGDRYIRTNIWAFSGFSTSTGCSPWHSKVGHHTFLCTSVAGITCLPPQQYC